MKTYNNLWQIFISDENIVNAVTHLSRGTKNNRIKKIVKTVLMEQSKENKPETEKIRYIAENFVPPKHKMTEIYDGLNRKKRTIIVPKPYEQVVHHMMINILKPIYLKGAYEHVYTVGDRDYGRNSGVHYGKRFIEKWIRKGGADIKYCLKMDIKKFFQSVPHDLLKKRHARIIKDRNFLDLIYKVIDTVPDEIGQPLGFFPSQWTTDWYLQPLDHYIKEQLRVKYYARYRDDMVIFGPNKKKLHKVLKAVIKYLADMGLELNNKWQIFRFNNGEKYRPLDFMGFKFYRNRTTLRKSILKRAKRSAMTIARKERPTIHDLKRFMSYLGWLDYTDTYAYYCKYIAPYVRIKYNKRRISAYDRQVAIARNKRNKQR